MTRATHRRVVDALHICHVCAWASLQRKASTKPRLRPQPSAAACLGGQQAVVLACVKSSTLHAGQTEHHQPRTGGKWVLTAVLFQQRRSSICAVLLTICIAALLYAVLFRSRRPRTETLPLITRTAEPDAEMDDPSPGCLTGACSVCTTRVMHSPPPPAALRTGPAHHLAELNDTVLQRQVAARAADRCPTALCQGCVVAECAAGNCQRGLGGLNGTCCVA